MPAWWTGICDDATLMGAPVPGAVRAERWAPALMLVASAALGQVASLWLVNVQPYAVLQHYWPWGRLVQWPLLAGTLVLAGQAAVCLTVAVRAGRELGQSLARVAPWWTLAFTAGVLVFAAAVPAGGVPRFAVEVILSSALMALAALNLALAVRVLPSDALVRFQEWLGARVTLAGAEAQRPWDAWVPRLAALWAFVICAAVAVVVFERLPHIDDELSYLFQAKYFAEGALWLPRPPDPDSFGVAHLVVDGDKWYGKFFPGWPVLLAPGVLIGAPWLVNPLLAAAIILLTHHLLRQLYDVTTAHAVTLLLAASPWFLFMSSSLMAHTASLFWMLLALVAIHRQRHRRAGAWALLAGVSLGMIFLTRPFDAVLVGPVLGLWAMGLGGARLRWSAIVVTGAAAAAVTGVYFLYNAALTGDPFIAPHRLWADRLFGPGVDVIGFGPHVGIPLWRNMDPLPGHGAADVILNANKNFFLVNFELFGWGMGSLGLACLACQRGALRSRDAVMIGVVLAVIGGHTIYWAPGGPDFGARYWYLTIVPLILLTVRGAGIVAHRLGERARDARIPALRVAAFVGLASAGAVLAVLPWRSVTKYHRYRDIGPDIGVIAAQHGITGGLVFIRSPRRSDYQAAFALNPRSLDDPANVFAWELDDARASAVLRGFPDRPVWIIGRGSGADRRLQLIAGPLPPGTKPPSPAREESLVSFQAVIR